MITGLFNVKGAAPLVLICEHASNFIPVEYHNLGLAEAELTRHIAYDPGALATAKLMAHALDAPLVFANVSRLVIDLNRDPADFDSMPDISETTEIPGNLRLSQSSKTARANAYYHPFHSAVDEVIAQKPDLRALISMHSFTPVYKGVSRPWHVGLITGPQDDLARAMLAHLRLDDSIVADLNVPYSPSDRVYHTLDRHSQSNRAKTAMIEVRNDLISTAEDQKLWAHRLSRSIRAALAL